jgi:oligosaccharide repeat unit polymerase
MFKIVNLWYLIIFGLSVINSFDIVPLSSTSIFIILLFIIFLNIGGSVSSLIFSSNKYIEAPLTGQNTDRINFFVLGILFYYFFLLFTLIEYVLTNGSDVMVYIRAIAFSEDYDSNPFFKSDLHLFIHRILIIPSIYSMYLIGLKNYFYFKKYKILLISVVLLLIDSIIMFGRLNIYYMLLIYVFGAFVYGKYKSVILFIKNKVNFNSFFVIISVVFFLFLITSIRSVDENDIFLKPLLSFIDYNLYGFRIFDNNLNDPNSIIHLHTFGRSMLGQVDAIFSIIYRLTVDSNFLPASSINGKFLDSYIDLGIKEVKTANAFGTLLFTFYRDFGTFGVIIYSTLLGIYLNFLDIKFKSTNNPKYFVFGLFIVYSLVFSIYQSVFEGIFWPMYFILSVNIFLSKRITQ